MRRLVEWFARIATNEEPGDPLEIHDALRDGAWRFRATTSEIPDVDSELPALAATLALGALDNAIHDAWGKCAGVPSLDLLRVELDRRGLPVTLRRRRRSLPVQHVVGLADALVAEPGAGAEPTLVDWLRDDGVVHLKIKVAGRDPIEDVSRIAAAVTVSQEHGHRIKSISVDPNEGYESAEAALEMLLRLRRDHTTAFELMSYLEQPTPRGTPIDSGAMRALCALTPIVADESVGEPVELLALVDSGWSGLAIKASRGQSMALLTYGHAQRRDLFVTLQDLTAVDLALVHSARLASRLRLSTPAFEFNSRQYAPAANARIRRSHPDLVAVRKGSIRVEGPPLPGIY